MPAVDELMSAHGITPEQLDGVVVDVGPGSFTGVRIGVASANAICYARRIPVYAVSSLQALYAASGKRDYAAYLDAGAGKGYAAIYRDKKTVLPPSAVEREQFLTLPEMEGLRLEEPLPAPSAAALIAAMRLFAVEGAEQALPLYLRVPQAERMRAQRLGRSE